MNFPELNLVVNMKRNDMFLATPVLTIAFRRYIEAGFSLSTLRALPFPSISAVAAVNVQAQAALQDPYARVVVRTWFRTHSQQLLVITVDVAGVFITSNDSAGNSSTSPCPEIHRTASQRCYPRQPLPILRNLNLLSINVTKPLHLDI